MIQFKEKKGFAMDTEALTKNAVHVGILIALVFALLFLLTFTGVVKCSQFPIFGEAWCDVYWGIKTFTIGSPRVLIVYGETGLGNPIGFDNNGSLEELLSDPGLVGARVDTLPVDRANLGNLQGYDMVIVDRARRIETKQLRAFIDYATLPTGGILVWTGDAGTELGPNDVFLYTKDKDPDADVNRPIGPWERRDNDKMILFDELLGVRPVDNDNISFCELLSCREGRPVNAGNLETEPSGDHPLIMGIAKTLPLYVFKGQDFAVVETLSGSITNEVLSLEFGSNISRPGADLNKSAPMIVTSGIGERVIYYALPPEYYANPKLLDFEKGRYLVPIENMYFGSLKG